MTEMLRELLQFLLALVGMIQLPDASVVALAAAVIAVTVATFVLVVITRGVPEARGAPHPARQIDVSTLLAQVDPNAAGHPRPRAPGRAALAAPRISVTP